MHPIMALAFVLLAAVALAPVTYVALAPEVLPVEVEPVVAAGSVRFGAVATPNHDPQAARLKQPPIAAPVAVAEPVAPGVGPMSFALEPRPTPSLNPVTLLAEPEPAARPAPPAPVFVATDMLLYARDSARLRAAPNTAADVLTKLAADAPLRATARSTDRHWWKVALADGRVGYVHRTAATQYRMVQTRPPSAPTPVAAAAPTRPVSTSRSDGLMGYVDDTMNWFTETASRGTAPAAVRAER